MPNQLQWKMFHYLNRHGELVSEWDHFQHMNEHKAQKFLSHYVRIKPLTKHQKKVRKNRRRV